MQGVKPHCLSILLGVHNHIQKQRKRTFTPRIKLNHNIYNVGRGGLMVSALDSGPSGPGLGPDLGTALCSWVRHCIVTVPLFTQIYKWVPAKLLLGVTL